MTGSFLSSGDPVVLLHLRGPTGALLKLPTIIDMLWKYNGTAPDIRALEIDGGPLLGMRMLEGSSLRIDVVGGGRVKILPLP